MGKKKTKTSSESSGQVVTTPVNPQWAVDAVQGVSRGVQALGGLDPSSLIAPLSAPERLAGWNALGLGRHDGAYDEAADWMRQAAREPAPSAGAASLLDNLAAYANPYRQQVTDVAMADFDVQAGRTRAEQALALAGAGAFGGSGAALARSQTEGELARARNSQLSALLSDMFNTSAGLANQDADRRQQASIANAQMAGEQAARRLQAASGLASLTGARAASAREDIAAQAQIGAQLREADQARRLAPYTALNAQADILAKLPLELFQGRTVSETRRETGTTTQSPSVLDMIGQAVDIATSGKAGGLWP